MSSIAHSLLRYVVVLCLIAGQSKPQSFAQSGYATHSNHERDNGRVEVGEQCTTPEFNRQLALQTASAKARVLASQAFKDLVERESAKRNSQTHVYFAWPLRAAPEYDHIPHYYTIPFFVDHDTSSVLLDYQCNERTYNDHHGTDINIWPFFWHMMASEYVEVIAAAPGIVLSTVDYNFNDMNCSCPEDAENNYVSIIHADSSVSYYMHVKDNSIVVNEDDVVEEGQLLAHVGSSGCSYNPHLHFEVHEENDALIDPFSGSCNGFNGTDTWWQNEKPYWEPRINRIMTHSTRPALHGYYGNNTWCASGEDINSKNQFNPGDSVWLGCAIYSMQPNDQIDFRIYNPSGTQIWSDTYAFTGSEPAVGTYYAFPRTLALNAPTGTYRFRAEYNGNVYNHWFTVGCTSSYSLSGALPFHHGYIASNSILNTGQTSGAGSTASYQCAGHIRFQPGFKATAGVSLKARIEPCNNTD